MNANSLRKTILVSVVLLTGTVFLHAAALDGTKCKIKLVPSEETARTLRNVTFDIQGTKE